MDTHTLHACPCDCRAPQPGIHIICVSYVYHMCIIYHIYNMYICVQGCNRTLRDILASVIDERRVLLRIGTPLAACTRTWHVCIWHPAGCMAATNDIYIYYINTILYKHTHTHSEIGAAPSDVCNIHMQTHTHTPSWQLPAPARCTHIHTYTLSHTFLPAPSSCSPYAASI